MNTNRCALCMLTFVHFFYVGCDFIEIFLVHQSHRFSIAELLKYVKTFAFFLLLRTVGLWFKLIKQKTVCFFFLKKDEKATVKIQFENAFSPFKFMELHMPDFTTRNKLRLFRDLIKDLMTFFSNPKRNEKLKICSILVRFVFFLRRLLVYAGV